MARVFSFSVILGLILIVFSSTNAYSQDPRFTQYYKSPLRLNPAMTGAFEGVWRLGANFRTQWGSVMTEPYTTYNVMGDMKFPVFNDDFFAVGLNAMTDISGGGVYNITDVGLSFSYHKKLSGSSRSYRINNFNSYLVAGAQIGFGQRSVRWDKLVYSTQYVVDDNAYNTNIASGEGENVRTSRLYPDMGAGLMWFANFGRRKSVYAGASIFHINTPEIGLINRTGGNVSQLEKLYMRFVVHAGGEYLLGQQGSLSLLPGFVGMFQGPSMELNFGCDVRYQGFKFDDFAIRVGLWNRLSNLLESNIHADALMVKAGIDWQNFQFALSYDINISSLMVVSQGQGSLEFSIIYVHDGSYKRGQGCPTF